MQSQDVCSDAWLFVLWVSHRIRISSLNLTLCMPLLLLLLLVLVLQAR
jgi:hypothetical protein